MRKFQGFLVLAVAALVVCGAGSAGSAGGAYSVILQPNGKIVVAGWGARGSQGGFGLARYKQSGALDATFGLRGKVASPLRKRSGASAVALQPDGKIVAAGYAGGDFANTFRFAVARYTTKGRLDHTFGSRGFVATKFGSGEAFATAVGLQPDGKIIAAGSNSDAQVVTLARYTRTGALDPSFGSGGKVQSTLSAGAFAEAMALQPDGKILVAGQIGSDVLVARYLSDGALDPSFGSGGVAETSLGSTAEARAVALQPDGKIVAAGLVEVGDPGTVGDEFLLIRYRHDGSLDPSFGTGGIVKTSFSNVISDLPYGGYVDALALQPDGKILAGGAQLVPYPDRGNFALARYKPNGSLDSSFGDGGKVTTSFGYSPPENPTEDGDVATGLAVRPDGKIVAAGYSQFGPHTEQYAVALARYLPNGSLDSAFGTGGLVKTSLAVCVVPKLGGVRMDWFAQQIIKGSHCAVGKIKRVHSRLKRRHIISERPRPGTVHVEGTKVRVVVSLGRRHR
jgi:uncharacterized delta-60 repeat protein